MTAGVAPLDPIDERLLLLLRDDARQPIAQLAKTLGMSRGQLYARLSRLEEAGVIAGYTVRLGPVFAESRVRAHMMIKALPRARRDVEQALSRMARIQALHAISGEFDIIALLESDNSAHLNDLIDEISMVDGVEKTITSVILATKLER